VAEQLDFGDLVAEEAGAGAKRLDGELAVRTFLGTHPEVDEVVPVERRQEKGRRHTELGEDRVGLALGIEVRNLVLAHQRRHAVVGERHEVSGVLQSGPDDVVYSGILGRLCHIPRLRELLFGLEVRPEERDAVCAVCALKRLVETFHIIDVASDDFRPRFGQGFRLVGVWVPGDRAGGERAAFVVEDRAHQSTALGAGSSDYGDDFLLHLIGHSEPPFGLGNRVGPDFQPPYRAVDAVLQD